MPATLCQNSRLFLSVSLSLSLLFFFSLSLSSLFLPLSLSAAAVTPLSRSYSLHLFTSYPFLLLSHGSPPHVPRAAGGLAALWRHTSWWGAETSHTRGSITDASISLRRRFTLGRGEPSGLSWPRDRAILRG